MCQLHRKSKAINECPILHLAVLFGDEFYVVIEVSLELVFKYCY